MILRYTRSDGSVVPAVAESVELADDAIIKGWRSVSDHGVGNFEGVLTSAESAALRELAGTAATASLPDALPAPGSAAEGLELFDGEQFSVAGVDESAPAPWPDLVTKARELLEHLTDFPLAAVVLERTTTGARLSHVGTDELTLDLSELELTMAAWHGYYESVESSSSNTQGEPRVTATPGWHLDLELPDEVPDGDDITVHLTATFGIIARTGVVAVQAGYAPAIQPSG